MQLVISDLIGPVQNYAVKGRSIQDNLHLVREVLERLEDGTKTFDRVDHRFFATILETTGFRPEFRKRISMMYHNPQAVVQVKGKRSKAFTIKRSVRQGFSLAPLLYVPAFEPLLREIRDEEANPTLHGIPFAGSRQKYPRTLIISLSLFRRLGIKAVNKAVARYEQIASAKINFYKNEGLRAAWCLERWRSPAKAFSLE